MNQRDLSNSTPESNDQPRKFSQAQELSGQRQFCIAAFNYIWRHGLSIDIWPLIIFLRGGSIEKQLYCEDVCRSLNESNFF